MRDSGGGLEARWKRLGIHLSYSLKARSTGYTVELNEQREKKRNIKDHFQFIF